MIAVAVAKIFNPIGVASIYPAQPDPVDNAKIVLYNELSTHAIWLS